MKNQINEKPATGVAGFFVAASMSCVGWSLQHAETRSRAPATQHTRLCSPTLSSLRVEGLYDAVYWPRPTFLNMERFLISV
jgi:hypothetical protein